MDVCCASCAELHRDGWLFNACIQWLENQAKKERERALKAEEEVLYILIQANHAHTSHVTRHTSYVTRHTSHITRYLLLQAREEARITRERLQLQMQYDR